MRAPTATDRMRRPLLLAAAATFFAVENAVTVRWLAMHGGVGAGLAHAWTAVREDAMVLLVAADMGIFTLAALVWFARDLAEREVAPSRRVAWLAATLVVGSPALLVYLALRPARAHPRMDRS